MDVVQGMLFRFKISRLLLLHHKQVHINIANIVTVWQFESNKSIVNPGKCPLHNIHEAYR